MSQVAVAADKRFRRAHVKPARRRGVWRQALRRLFKYGVLAPLVAYAAYRSGELAMHAPVLQIDQIVVKGNERLPTGEILAVLSGLKGENLVWTDLAAWQRRLNASPWVREVALRRSLPSTVEVEIAERDPIGIARIAGDLYLIDDRGLVIDQYGPQYADLNLPLVDGLGTSGGDVVRGDLAARIIRAVRPHSQIGSRLSQIDVTNPRNAAVILSGDRALLYVGDEMFLPRLQSYLGLASALRERVPNIDYVDLRFADRIYVRPAGASVRKVAVRPTAASRRR